MTFTLVCHFSISLDFAYYTCTYQISNYVSSRHISTTYMCVCLVILNIIIFHSQWCYYNFQTTCICYNLIDQLFSVTLPNVDRYYNVVRLFYVVHKE